MPVLFLCYNCGMNKSAAAAQPTLAWEQQLWAGGCRAVAGVDEAGRGALAGPVVAAAVIIAPEQATASVWQRVRDSKLLTPRQRELLAVEVRAAALAWGVGCAAAAVIDQIGIAAATRQAMAAAIQALTVRPDYLLIDWVRLPAVNIPQTSRAKADRTMASVAAASILAKVQRDRWMVELDCQYPLFGFAAHKGYGAATHLAAVAQHGPCPEHRRSFCSLCRPALVVCCCRPP